MKKDSVTTQKVGFLNKNDIKTTPNNDCATQFRQKSTIQKSPAKQT